MTKMTINKNCRACHSQRLTRFLDLGQHPPSNSFLRKDQLNDPEDKFPLEVYFCEDCHLAQLIHIVNPDIMFRDYVYFSSLMPRLSDHFGKYAEDVTQRFLKPNDLVVELGSNDGVLLKWFRENGMRITGVDPAENIAKLANENGIPTIPEYFSYDIAKSIVGKQGRAKAILGNNVIAHINNYGELWGGIAHLLDQDGAFVLEAPYLVDMFENLTFDTVYHEHLSYLALRPLIAQANRFGLEVFDVKVVPSQGQSIRVFTGHKDAHLVQPSVINLVALELKLGLDKIESYHELAKKIENCKNQVISVFREAKKRGEKNAACGAPAKGNTVLNYFGLDHTILDFALDEIPTKQGLYTPGTHIPVVGKEYALAHLPRYYLLLAWNYAHVIIPKEKEFLAAGGTFVMPTGKTITAHDVKEAANSLAYYSLSGKNLSNIS